ncbi:hypothetical protein NMY3_00705 [Candidatus Nitrosocosmicus oleophilus]|uniref:Activation-induced cytidine deaminase AID domain-containing protein n=1 Tax=Candidatus Nitrosocosmicus oleophilus TaxID=1353260 RepID=A0A654LU13_9ARCH|nr:hypothetical protein [Candidatus Nitrosocosmicus oleophilus]ALI34914.1 hypothetical protein NMY3_00705 [Candidatus Nitrosocosmicus oleophilus]
MSIHRFPLIRNTDPAIFSNERYLDNFVEIDYDKNYKSNRTNNPKILKLKYRDNVTIEILQDHIRHDFLNHDYAIRSFKFYMGFQNRLYPSSLNPYTVPRLCYIKSKIIEITSITDMDRMVLIPSRRFPLSNSENENYELGSIKNEENLFGIFRNRMSLEKRYLKARSLVGKKGIYVVLVYNIYFYDGRIYEGASINTGDPRSLFNGQSHAEGQFDIQFRKLITIGGYNSKNIREVIIKISHSPCQKCGRTLHNLQQSHPKIKWTLIYEQYWEGESKNAPMIARRLLRVFLPGWNIYPPP